MAPMNWLNEVKWDAQGLVPVIAQEQGTGDVLIRSLQEPLQRRHRAVRQRVLRRQL